MRKAHVSWRRLGRIALGVCAVLAILVALAIGTVIFMPNRVLHHVATTRGSTELGRDVSMGDIAIDWHWSTPRVRIPDVRLANSKDAKDPDMIHIEQVDFRIRIWRLLKAELNLPELTLTKPKIILEKKADGSKNWDFPALSSGNVVTEAAVPQTRQGFPIMDRLTVKEGVLAYNDEKKKLALELGIDTALGQDINNGTFKLTGKGKLQDKAFDLNAEGGALAMLRKSDESYPLILHIKMGDTTVDIDGQFKDPIKMDRIDTKLNLRGGNMADLFYLTAIPLPPTPAYSLGGHLHKEGEIWTFNDFDGRVGQSDLYGNLTYDTTTERGFVKADLKSRLLSLKDLGGFIGAPPGSPSAREESPNVLPDMPLKLERLRATDLDITLKADRILAQDLPMDDMDVRFGLKDGILKLDPLRFGVAQGQIAGVLVLNGQEDMPSVQSRLDLKRMAFKQFFKAQGMKSLTEGFFEGYANLQGRGHSLAEVLGNSDGRMALILPQGRMSELVVDAAALDAGKAIPIVLSGDKPTPVYCAVADFEVDNGLMTSRSFVIDTEAANINGEAAINLKDETIDARVEANPKDPTISGNAPIIITGKLKKPGVTLYLGALAGRGAIAAALSVLFPPLAVIPFLDEGSGEDADCQSLIRQARLGVKEGSGL